MLGLGRLPSDIFIQRDGFTFYAPITIGILIRLVLSFIAPISMISGADSLVIR